MAKKIKKDIVIKKLGRAISDKIRVNGEPFEVVKGLPKGTTEKEGLEIAREYSKSRETETHKPYLAVGVYHGQAEDIYTHRWAMINKRTGELEEI